MSSPSFVTATVVALLVAVGACTGSSSDPNPAKNSADDQLAGSTGIDAARQPPAAKIEGATKGGIVTVSTSSAFGPAPETLDPTQSYNRPYLAILSGLVTRSLTQYVYDPELDSMMLVPDIATDIGTPNEDFTEWTYTVREGVRFEDGTEVTADDVAYGIKRSFDRQNFKVGPSYSNEFFLHGDTYRGPTVSGTDYDGIVVEGDTLTLKMARPFPDMPYWASFPAIGPIPEGRSDPEEYKSHPLATGPYKIGGYEPGMSLTLVRNDQWDSDTDPGRHDYPDEYHFDFNAPVQADILAGTDTGRTTLQYSYVPTGAIRTALDEAPDLLTVGPGACVGWMALDMRKITDLGVRQAVGYAYPYADHVAALGGIDGVTVKPGRTLLPPGFPGGVDYNPLETPAGETDPDRAKALLEEAGQRGYELIFNYVDDPSGRAIKDVLTRAFVQAGFTVDARPTAGDDIYNREIDRDSPSNIRYSGAGWCADWPSGNDWLPSIVSSRDTGSNRAYLHDPAIDAEIERIRELRLPEQPAAWGALDEMVETEYYPYVVTRYNQNVMLHGSRIGGMNNDEVREAPTFKDIYVIE
jgi:peptide/nickel transport system substrate-binding protein